MIVYGDPSTQESFATLVARLSGRNPARVQDSIDDARVRLIFAGQLEQAVEDAGLADHAAACRTTTDRCAEAFLNGNAAEVEGLEDLPDAPLTVKLPEGFAFYGLYPEAYVVAVGRWLSSLSTPPGRVAVIGIRSIGTTLSAVVRAALRAKGIEAFRLTVRPTGHPFARETTLPPFVADYSLVVDEGPGLSGSSMASVAEALVQNGFPKDRIVFLPGHSGDPGDQASVSVRAWWREAPRFSTPTEDLRWNGLTLEEMLLAHTKDAVAIEEISGGSWREKVFTDSAEWPGVALPFERRKLRVSCEDGSAILWKFVGLSVPSTVLGFAAYPWVEGRPMFRLGRKTDPVPILTSRILEAAEPPLPRDAARAAWVRLEEMLRVNAERAGLSYRAKSYVYEETPTAGDYRLAPWEWRCSPEGMTKASRVAPTLDHTVVGRQPLAWDVAGAMVEWNLSDPTGLPEVPGIDFYRAAYAAFRMGQCLMCADETEEGDRLRRDADFYRQALAGALKSFLAPLH